MKWGGVVLLLLLISVVHATTTAELESAMNSAAQSPELRQMLGAKALIVLKVGSQADYYAWNGNSFSRSGPGTADFTISASESAVVSLSNAEDKSSQLKCLLAGGNIIVKASDLSKQAAIQAYIRTQVSCAPRTWYYSPNHNAYIQQAQSFGIHFARPPGILARNPGLIYDTVSKSPNAVGPWNIFKINPGLVGPNDILRLNPGLIGPADMAILNPNLHGPAEFAYMMGIGAHSNTARHLSSQGTLNLNLFSPTNRWGNRR